MSEETRRMLDDLIEEAKKIDEWENNYKKLKLALKSSEIDALNNLSGAIKALTEQLKGIDRNSNHG